MSAGQSKRSLTVIEGRRAPGCRRVTLRAIVVEIPLDVVRIFDRREFVLVTAITCRRGAGVSGGVTGSAIDVAVRAC